MRLTVPVVAASLVLLMPAASLAHGGGAALPAEVPAPPPGDGATAAALLKALEQKAAQDPETAKVVAEPLKNAKRALQRAHGARVAGDDLHARMLDSLAKDWAEAAGELDRAAAAERVAGATAKKAHEVKTKVERARALLEETQARRGRAAAELERVEAEAKERAGGAASVEAKRLAAAKKAAAKKAPAKKGGR